MASTLHLDGTKPADVARAAAILRTGGTVAFPTETVYGLGANALSEEAVAGIFAAKQRPSWDPLIVHVARPDEIFDLTLIWKGTELRRRVEALSARFWPGPLTMLLPRRPMIPDAVTAGRPLVGIRVPAHPTAQALLCAEDIAIAAPSANRFGHTSPTTAQHVFDDLDGRINAVLDAGPTGIGVESTVLDPGTTPMTLYRPGPLTPEQLEQVAGVRVSVYQVARNEETRDETNDHATLPAPGVGLRHYAPRARLVLVDGNEQALHIALAQASERHACVGVLLPVGWQIGVQLYLVEPWAPWEDPQRLAANLFSGLRRLDARGAEAIYCPLPEAGGLGDAIRDRLQKAARLV